MALVTCGDCHKEISSAAPACPHCGAPGLASSKRRTAPKWLILLLLVGGCAIVATLVNRPDPQREADLARLRTIDACHDAARARLKAPASAKFPSNGDAGVRASKVVKPAPAYKGIPIAVGTQFVESFVDAQNSFGALIRNRFTCAVSPAGEVLVVEFVK